MLYDVLGGQYGTLKRCGTPKEKVLKHKLFVLT